MADAPQLTTDQYNFCRAVEAMKLDLLRSGKEAGWLVAHPGVLTLSKRLGRRTARGRPTVRRCILVFRNRRWLGSRPVSIGDFLCEEVLVKPQCAVVYRAILILSLAILPSISAPRPTALGATAKAASCDAIHPARGSAAGNAGDAPLANDGHDPRTGAWRAAAAMPAPRAGAVAGRPAVDHGGVLTRNEAYEAAAPHSFFMLNPYVSTATDFVYVVTGVRDRTQGVNLSYACGLSYGEMSVHGAGYAYVQYNDLCGLATFSGRVTYEALIHEWYHNLDWAFTTSTGCLVGSLRWQAT